jgi:hypothetical protein
VRRLLSSPAIQFKGTGWYITDYSQKGKSSDKSATDASAPASSTDSKGASASDTTPSKKETPAPAVKPAASDS